MFNTDPVIQKLNVVHWCWQNKIKKNPSLLKIQGDSYTSDIAESKHDNQTYHPPMLWERELNLKNYTYNKKVP
jgi:hypothetical protein